MIGAAGWELPGYYTSPLEEHKCVRSRVGVTDFSSMGEIDVKGPDATQLMEKLTVNNVGTVPVGRVVYTTMVDERGIIVDDVTVYRLAEEHYLMVTSTANHEKSWAWVSEHATGCRAYVTDVSAGVALTCVQGPHSRDLLAHLTDLPLDRLRYYWAAEAEVAGVPCLVSRTGFTGELGYEIYHPSYLAVHLWETLLTAGEMYGIRPVGIVPCAGTLRLEKAYVSGPEIEGSTPLELPISWTVKWGKDFIGKAALLRQKQEGLTRRLVGLRVQGACPKAGAELTRDGRVVGRVTSACYGPTVMMNIALAFVPPEMAQPGETFRVLTQGGDAEATVVPIPFYDPHGKRLRS